MKLVGAEIHSVKLRKTKVSLVDTNVLTYELLAEALSLATEIGLKTLDLLHLTYAKKFGCDAFATLDKEIIKREKEIHNIIKIL